jgi:plastocyanin
LYRILPASASSEPILSKSQPESQNPQTSSSESKSNDAANKVTVNIVGVKGDTSYQPNPISIKRGQTVTWLNGDVVSHTVTSGTDNDVNAGKQFDSKAILAGQSYSRTFSKSGTYEYYCFYHPSMVGEIIVN